jgi:general secretion pathway protein H
MPSRCRGFTLLELMIVIVLIGVLVGMVSFATGMNPARQARQEADALAGVMRQLREQAVLDSQEYGVRLSAHGYRAMQLECAGLGAAGGLLSMAGEPAPAAQARRVFRDSWR